jgi:pimeloyl-ACP methyl ester carboxylesterase
VYAPDLPGFGVSPSGPDVASAVGADPQAPSVDVMADGVAAALRASGVERAVVAGLSMGGYVALALLERHPELVAGLGLVDTRSTADDEPTRERRREVADTVTVQQTVEAVLGMRTALLGATNRTTRTDLVERIEAWIRDQGPAAVAWAQRAMATRPDRTAVLAGYRGPAVVVVGEEDEIAPLAEARHMVDALAAGRLVVVPGAGHMTTVEIPEPVAAALTALAALAGPVAG